MRRISGLALASILLAAGCAGAPPQPTPVGTPAVTVPESARNLAYENTQLSIPANQTFAVDFTNYDSAPHNISIRGSGGTRTGEVFSGPGERTYVFAGLPAGTYQFVCEVHPAMTGSLVAS